MSTDQLTRSQHVDLPAEPVRVAERPLVRALMLLVGLAVVVALPWLVYPPVATDILAWGLFAISVDLLLGFTGLLSFGHAAFWGASAYATGLVAIHTGLPFPVAILAGASVYALWDRLDPEFGGPAGAVLILASGTFTVIGALVVGATARWRRRAAERAVLAATLTTIGMGLAVAIAILVP